MKDPDKNEKVDFTSKPGDLDTKIEQDKLKKAAEDLKNAEKTVDDDQKDPKAPTAIDKLTAQVHKFAAKLVSAIDMANLEAKMKPFDEMENDPLDHVKSGASQASSASSVAASTVSEPSSVASSSSSQPSSTADQQISNAGDSVEAQQSQQTKQRNRNERVVDTTSSAVSLSSFDFENPVQPGFGSLNGSYQNKEQAASQAEAAYQNQDQEGLHRAVDKGKRTKKPQQMDAKFEKKAPKESKKQFSEKVTDGALDLAEQNHLLADELAKLNQQNASLKQQKQLREQVKAAQKLNKKLSREHPFLDGIKDGWRKGREIAHMSAGQMFIKGTVGTVKLAWGALKLTGRLALEGAVIATGGIAGGTKMLRDAVVKDRATDHYDPKVDTPVDNQHTNTAKSASAGKGKTTPNTSQTEMEM